MLIVQVCVQHGSVLCDSPRPLLGSLAFGVPGKSFDLDFDVDHCVRYQTRLVVQQFRHDVVVCDVDCGLAVEVHVPVDATEPPLILSLQVATVAPLHDLDGEDVFSGLDVRGDIELGGQPAVLGVSHLGSIDPAVERRIDPFQDQEHVSFSFPSRRQVEFLAVASGRIDGFFVGHSLRFCGVFGISPVPFWSHRSVSGSFPNAHASRSRRIHGKRVDLVGVDGFSVSMALPIGRHDEVVPRTIVVVGFVELLGHVSRSIDESKGPISRQRAVRGLVWSSAPVVPCVFEASMGTQRHVCVPAILLRHQLILPIRVLRVFVVVPSASLSYPSFERHGVDPFGECKQPLGTALSPRPPFHGSRRERKHRLVQQRRRHPSQRRRSPFHLRRHASSSSRSFHAPPPTRLLLRRFFLPFLRARHVWDRDAHAVGVVGRMDTRGLEPTWSCALQAQRRSSDPSAPDGRLRRDVGLVSAEDPSSDAAEGEGASVASKLATTPPARTRSTTAKDSSVGTSTPAYSTTILAPTNASTQPTDACR
mmetsp:Transcript_10589/g.65165  ORF Transcript_10589/g.65165 Transcript_10589/m.65165 type:complete len:534 (-) Transcript_10589:5328-6929(-)